MSDNDIRHAFSKLAPYDLISNGAPDDEYDSYIALVISGIKNKNPDEEIASKLQQAFQKSFSVNYSGKECLKIVETVKGLYTA